MEKQRFDLWRNALNEEKLRSLDDSLQQEISINKISEMHIRAIDKYLIVKIGINEKVNLNSQFSYVLLSTK